MEQNEQVIFKVNKRINNDDPFPFIINPILITNNLSVEISPQVEMKKPWL